MIDSPRGDVTDHDPADLQLIPGFLSLVEIAREDACLQPENRGVDLVEGDIEILELTQHRDRTEGLLAHDVLLRSHALEQRRV